MPDFDFSPGLFADPDRATRNLIVLHETFIRSGSRFSVHQFSSVVNEYLAVSPDADMALVNFLRFNEASVSKATLFNDLIEYPVTLELLIKIFGHSQYFADILVREPGLFRWLTTTDVLSQPLSRKDLREEIMRLRTTFPKPERRLEALKRIHRREMLRIGTQDLLGLADLGGVTLQLSDLADVIVDEVYELSSLQILERFGMKLEVPFSVIALGKLGGQELNYSSDIDVMFVYESDGEVTPPGRESVPHREFFVRLAEQIVQNLSTSTSSGSLYRVDTRLRPESGAGPLALSLQGYLTYYESRGELWERQMLIKARAIAGDDNFGERFIGVLDPFVYPRSHLVHPAEYITRIKNRIEAAIGEEANVKLMRGGIRDVEFVAQALQLLHGGTRQELKERNTLRALEALTRAGLVSDQDAEVLREGYFFFRTLEHRLQTVFNSQTHVLPDDSRSRHVLARRLGLPDEDALLRKTRSLSHAVREVFTRNLSSSGELQGGSGEGEGGMLTLMDGGLSEPSVRAVLARYGFRDFRLAARQLRTLMSGSSLTDFGELDARSREALRSIAPQLFTAIARTPVPEITLGNLTTIATAQKFPEQFFSLLSQEGFRDPLLKVCALSSRFSKGLASDPFFLETLATHPDFLAPGETLSMAPARDLRSLKRQQELRAGVRHILGLSDFNTMTSEVTSIADFIVSTVLEEEARDVDLRDAPLAVFALGKFGTGELTFDADIDLLFIGEGGGVDLQAKLEGLVGSMMARLTAIGDGGKLYEVDARLRPEGRNAPLIVSEDAYASYLRSRASLWERQSLTRFRCVAGDQKLANRVTGQVVDFVYGSPLPKGWITDTVAMRRRTEKRSRLSGDHFVDFKLGPGGMVDIEFLAQMIQLSSHRTDLFRRTIPDLFSISDLPTLDRHEREYLATTYLTFRRTEMLLRILLELRVHVLPVGENLDRLARCMGFSDGGSMAGEFQETMRAVRSLFLRISDRLKSDDTEAS